MDEEREAERKREAESEEREIKRYSQEYRCG